MRIHSTLAALVGRRCQLLAPLLLFAPQLAIQIVIQFAIQLAFAFAPAPAQEGPPPRARLALSPEPLSAFVDRQIQLLERHRDIPRTAEQRTGPLLAWLWLGRHDLARNELRAEAMATPMPNGDDAAWLLLHHYWTFRAISDRTELADHWPTLAAAGLRLVEDRGPCTAEPTLERAVLRLHALSCAGALAAAAEDQSLATKFDLRARSALDEFEARYWSPSRAAFVESADTDEPASLFACAIGMLATTGDRTAIHGQSALAERSVGRVPDPERTLVAMAQFDAARGDLLADLLMQPTDDPHRAGLAIDAVLFAATGMRMATGPGMDEAWTRLRPCLPTGIDRIAVRGLVHDGHACEFEYERRHDEHVGRYTLRREGDGKGWRQLVVHQDGRTFVAPAIDGEPVTLTSTAPTAAQPRDRATSNPSR